MAIRFLIDSSSDISLAEAEAHGIAFVPMTVSFGQEEYRDGVDLDKDAFYEKLIESDVLPRTAQVPPHVYSRVFADLTANGDTVITITISSAFSGTYQSACLAAQDFPGKVYVVDSRNVSIGEQLLILRALEMAREGMPAEALVAKLEQERESIRVLAVLETLEYLRKGGRIPAALAVAGDLLNIRSVVAVEEGKVHLVGKARGSKNGNNLLRKLVLEGRGINFSRPHCVAYSGLSDAVLRKYMQDHADLWQTDTCELPVRRVGSAIGTHIGPGAIAVAFFEKD